MRGPARTSLALALLAAGAGLARADVVHLSNGRTIEGRVVEEDTSRVVVKTPAGRVTIPRRDVACVEREAEARTLLREARLARAAGDRAAAERLYDAAAAAGDPEVAAIVARERDELSADEPGGVDEHDAGSPAADRPPGGDPFVEVEREALIRELEAATDVRPDLKARLAYELFQRAERRHAAGDCRLAASDYARAARWVDEAEQAAALRDREARCRLQVAHEALRRRDAALARAAAAPVVDHPQHGARAAYLLGRAEERLRRPRDARAAFRRALGGVSVPPDHDLPTLRELARLAATGVPVDASTPGLGAGWRCTQTRSFSVLHDQPLLPTFPGDVEAVRAEVLARLALRVDDEARIALFVFADEAAYQRAPGARAWSAGHAARLQAGGEVVPTIYLHTQGDATARLQHELAHILVGDALDDALLPMWAAEGVAVYAEHAESRRRWREEARRLHARGELAPVGDALGRMLLPLTDDRAAIFRFYVQASLMFDVLAARVGVARALEAARRINTDGPDGALRSVGLRLDAFERAVEAALTE